MEYRIWKSSQYIIKTTLRLSPILYGSECWRMTEIDLNKLSSFRTKNLRKIIRIFWHKTISNHYLLSRCNQDSLDTIMRHWDSGDESDMRQEESRATSPAQPFTGGEVENRQRWVTFVGALNVSQYNGHECQWTRHIHISQQWTSLPVSRLTFFCKNSDWLLKESVCFGGVDMFG